MIVWFLRLLVVYLIVLIAYWGSIILLEVLFMSLMRIIKLFS